MISCAPHNRCNVLFKGSEISSADKRSRQNPHCTQDRVRKEREVELKQQLEVVKVKTKQ